jgi:hypothetical protein
MRDGMVRSQKRQIGMVRGFVHTLSAYHVTDDIVSSFEANRCFVVGFTCFIDQDSISLCFVFDKANHVRNVVDGISDKADSKAMS